ncbi:MAG: hypothetical protein RID15_00585 [Marinovum algicola]|uniref:Uncharacterized protein n=1 Tax=Marinovum algicola TaxID=42444 RepID=A0A975W9H6_9RHOB|nr:MULTISPECIES: hypothetical protein [Marinovum]MDD9741896.1 hypothetical protein [Marinovum sp. SP66]SEJ36763.1 hypothetical protein SAMN04487940_105127 [Marinovum algicola]SLN39217.1 hypothetical protein MAA5396_01874 [Marinovum algicola]
MLTSDDIAPLFTRADGSYLFARWGRPIAPIVFGVTEATLPVIKGAMEAVVAMAGHQMAETDPELGSNCMFFFFRDWDELTEVPDLDKLVPDLAPLVTRLKAAEANQYRVFRFDDQGAIKAAFVFLRMDKELGAQPAADLALGQVVQVMLLWSEQAFAEVSPLAIAGGRTVLRPEIGAVIRAGYDPVMPAVAQDPSHALRLAARVGMAQ